MLKRSAKQGRRSRKRHLESTNDERKSRKQLKLGDVAGSQSFDGTTYKREEERRLEKVLFSDASEIIRNLRVNDTQDQHDNKDSGVDEGDSGDGIFSDDDDGSPPYHLDSEEGEDKPERHPAWVDEEDVNLRVKDVIHIPGRRAPMQGEHNALEEYTKVLKKRYESAMGVPKWAQAGSKPKRDSSEDEEESEELLQQTGHLLSTKTAFLPSGTIDAKRLQDLNYESRCEGYIIKCVEFHPSAQVALVAGLSGTTTLYQVDGRSNPKIQSVHFENFKIRTARFTHGGNEFLVGSQNHGYLYNYDMIAGKIIKIPWDRSLEQAHMQKFEVSPDGRLLVVHGRFGAIHLLAARTKEWISTLKMNGEVNSVAFTPDGSKMFSHGEGGEVYIWDVNSRTCLHKFIDDGSIVGQSVTVSPNQQYLACGSESGVVNIYSTDSVASSTAPRPLKTILNLVTPATSIKFNSSSEILAIGSDTKDNAVKLVHCPSMTVFSNFPGFQTNLFRPQCVNFSVNSGFLALGNNHGGACLYRLGHYGSF